MGVTVAVGMGLLGVEVGDGSRRGVGVKVGGGVRAGSLVSVSVGAEVVGAGEVGSMTAVVAIVGVAVGSLPQAAIPTAKAIEAIAMNFIE